MGKGVKLVIWLFLFLFLSSCYISLSSSSAVVIISITTTITIITTILRAVWRGGSGVIRISCVVEFHQLSVHCFIINLLIYSFGVSSFVPCVGVAHQFHAAPAKRFI